ncbi:FtsK/SpoIIIE domain-containing protein [Arthrobacter sp. ok362]|uniref:FtsK/SpoIIIE domain-containing protein n=1 Tax=Arthrobacter sp. ok362 TaxID=1761745 RepID=UPI00088A1282|nr:FtsK/SpoIIIE domain-containing protein [Arthrobacter sp. ok362]SDK77500.1 DNA segregation ATPase FtsK/SpoIIIE, S-DNA-T family [Arthrobacter sp. ok362]
MIFHCTLAPRTLAPSTLVPSTLMQSTPTSGSTPDVQLIELSVEVPEPCPGADLESAIARRYGTGGLSVRGVPLAAMIVGEPPLVPGAVLVENAVLVESAVLAEGAVLANTSGAASRPGPGRPETATLLLAVDSGPGAGTLVALRRGQFRIGRSGTGIVIPDAALSREHARLDVSDSDVTIVDLGSANGTSVDGRKVRMVPVTTASSIRCGDSTISLRLGPLVVPNAATDSVTALAGSSVGAPLVIRGTAASSHRVATALAAVLPLLAGVGLALLTGMWMFLAFTAVSGVSVLVPFLSGRRQRRELNAAVAEAALQDRERRRQAAPSAADLAIGCAAGASPAARVPHGEPRHICLRLGLADQRANIRLEPPDSGFRPPPLGQVPLTLDPAPAVVTIHGPAPAVAGLVRSFILQLASYPLGGRTRLLLHGPADTVPFSARFLPGVTMSANDATTAALLAAGPGGLTRGPGEAGGPGEAAGPGDGFDRGVLIFWSTPGQSGAAPGPDIAGAGPAFRTLATAHGWRVIECSPEQGPAEHPGIVLGRRSTLIAGGAPPMDFVPDLVPAVVFDRFCRGFNATHAAVTLPPAIPQHCSLADVLPLAAPDISRRWSRAGAEAGLGAPVGAGSLGTLRIDLKADGPHFLVAGTTGSGKSEFLRTLAAGLAASHPPDRVNLLFIDFKGGSGLGPLTGLPHCVGMLTDLAAAQVERTLVSLRAEVRRREELLARVDAPDLAAYESSPAAGPPVPYLVIVVDEFRILVDEVPGALSELMRIAAIGRSLGIHLIMATQRPQGALNADIRANVTTCTALRVQSGPESFDIMGSGLAAAIPITRPGRAFLIRGAQAPEEFQTATLTPRTAARTDGAVSVRTVTEFLTRAPAVPGVRADAGAREAHDGGAALTPTQGAALLIDTTVGLWQDRGGRPPRRPVADPLPALLPHPGPGPADGDTVRLGRVDLPELQRVAELGWSPAGHGHLGLVGAEAGAGDTALALAVDQLLTAKVESHLYVLDAAGVFSAAAAAPRVGTVVGLHEVRRAARVLRRIAQETTSRLSGHTAGPRPRLVLVLSGWGAWVSAFRSGPLAWAEDLVHDIVRDGSRAGITVIVSGERELVTARFFAGLPNRIFFPAGSTDEGRLAWPRLPALEPVAGRVAVFGAFVPARLATGHAAQLFEPMVVGGRHSAGGAVTTRPFRVDALPVLVTVDEVLAQCGNPGPGQRIPPPARLPAAIPAAAHLPVPAAALLLGVGGDELRPHGIRLPAGGVLAVLGGPGAGKSTLLAALPGMNPTCAWLAPQPGTDPGQYWSGLHASALAGTLDRTAIALADDADLLAREANSALAALNSLGWRVILTAGFGPAFGQRVDLAAIARSQGQAVLIRPRGLMDGEPFGVRFETEHGPPPGRAVVISEGRATPVQLAAPGPAAQLVPVPPAGGQVRISAAQHAARDGPLKGGRGSGSP